MFLSQMAFTKDNKQSSPARLSKVVDCIFVVLAANTAAKQTLCMEPCDDFKEYGMLRAFEVVVICWEVHLRNSGTGLLVSRDVW